MVNIYRKWPYRRPGYVTFHRSKNLNYTRGYIVWKGGTIIGGVIVWGVYKEENLVDELVVII